jgi:hypothetical protein
VGGNVGRWWVRTRLRVNQRCRQLHHGWTDEARVASDNCAMLWMRYDVLREMPSLVAGPSRARRAARSAPGREWLNRWSRTTPGKLTLLAVLVVVGAICFGVIATGAERSRQQAAQAARTQTEPLLVQSVDLYTALSDANATATTTFLKGGLEPPARRARYVADVNAASRALATLTGEVGDDPVARAAVQTIGRQLPVYAGLIESARANNLQGYPIGAAYLRQASSLLTGSILPAADRVYAAEARRLTDDYATGTAAAATVALGAVILIALALLVYAQAYVARVSRRILNPLMLGATAVLLAISTWAVVGMVQERNSLASARHAADSVEVLSATRVLVSRAQSDQSLTLANRGSDETDPVDFTHVMAKLGSGSGLLAEIRDQAETGAATAASARLDHAFGEFRAQAARITAEQSSGRTGAAIGDASSPQAAGLTDQLNANLSSQIAAAQRQVVRAGRDATSALAGLWIVIPVLTFIAAGLAVLGVWQRLREYR